jgi:hypothetical protein
MNEVPNSVSTGLRSIDEADTPKEKPEIPLIYQLERTGDTSPPGNMNIKAILHDSFCISSKQGSYHRLSAHMILSMVGRRDTRLIDAQNFLDH